MFAKLIALVLGSSPEHSATWPHSETPSPRSMLPSPAPAQSFYASRAWKVIRYKALVASQGRCLCCGHRPTSRNALQVDHVKPRSKYPALALDGLNLQVLCADCNQGKGAWDETDWRVVR